MKLHTRLENNSFAIKILHFQRFKIQTYLLGSP